jgi:poly-gamma-glutamate capsule biosynthesis protein CapA/YwtB (metallophosphatase superfamily)
LPPGAGPQGAVRAREFEILAGGDILVHDSVRHYAYAFGRGRYDFRPMFAHIRPVVRRSALAICHLETPIGAGPPSGFPVFNSPPELADALKWVGWSVCSTASNHSADRGELGIAATAHALDRVGIAHTGSFASRAEASKILLLDVRGVKIAVLAYTFGLNAPAPRPWSVNLISRRKIVRDSRRARDLGAQLVIVNLHWGDEYTPVPTPEQEGLATYLLEHESIDLILGQHAHAVQPIRELDGRFVVFGQGNLLSGMNYRPGVRDGLIAVAHVRAEAGRARITRVDYIPTWVQQPGSVIHLAGFELLRLIAQRNGRNSLADELRDSYDRTVRCVGCGPSIHPLPLSVPDGHF